MSIFCVVDDTSAGIASTNNYTILFCYDYYPHVLNTPFSVQAVLAEKKCCPFTKQPLTWEQCKILTKNNIHLYADRIIK